MIKEAIARHVKKEDLSADQMNDVMEEIMTGEATDAQKAAFLTDWQQKERLLMRLQHQPGF